MTEQRRPQSTLVLSRDDQALQTFMETGVPVGPLMDHLVQRMELGCVHSRSLWLILCCNLWGVDPVEMLQTVLSGQAQVGRLS